MPENEPCRALETPHFSRFYANSLSRPLSSFRLGGSTGGTPRHPVSLALTYWAFEALAFVRRRGEELGLKPHLGQVGRVFDDLGKFDGSCISHPPSFAYLRNHPHQLWMEV